jgi:Cd2+/Zn2+-exporting ATPase
MSQVNARPDPAGHCELIFGVPDMDCASCAQRISARLARLDGVEAVEPRVILKDVRVRFDPSRTAEDVIAEAVRSLGYTVQRDGRELEVGLAGRRGVWSGSEAWRTYVAGFGIALGLLLRLIDLTPTIWAGPPAALDAASLLFVAAALVGGLNFFAKGLRAARIVRLDMNFLMTVAIFGALIIGEYVEAASIAFLFGIAELLERYSVERARRSIESLLDLKPATARVSRDGDLVTVAVDELVAGDKVHVAPGEKIPIDGWIRDGASAVDQSPITGESLPISKTPGDYVYAGSMNQQGYLEIEAAKDAADTTLAHIIHLVEEAEAARSPSERFVERFARYYTPAVTVLAVLVMILPPLLLSASFATWFVRGLTLLVVSCPCALVISTPVAVVSGITSAARNGVLIKGGVHLEALAGIRAVAIDKTGTLTTGQVAFVEIMTADGNSQVRETLALAAALADRSEHPISQAIARAADERGVQRDFELIDFQETPGVGLQGRLDGTTCRLGRPDLFATRLERWKPELERVARSGQTPVCLGVDEEVIGLIAVADRERDESRDSILQLKRQGLGPIVMLTGDHEETARAVAERLGVDEWHAGLLPQAKVDIVRDLAARYGRVAMVGDGVNDAPALAAATVGIAMGAAASDVALETADVAVMAEDLNCLPYLFRLSRRGGSVIRQNVVASIAIKFSLAAGALPGWVTLITAVLVGDMGASLAVTGNALRLGRLRR